MFFYVNVFLYILYYRLVFVNELLKHSVHDIVDVYIYRGSGDVQFLEQPLPPESLESDQYLSITVSKRSCKTRRKNIRERNNFNCLLTNACLSFVCAHMEVNAQYKNI